MDKITVVGGGSWGTALARVLAVNGHDTTLYIRNEKQYSDLINYRINKRYLPDVELPENLKYSNDLVKSIENSNVILVAVPTNSVRETLMTLKPYLNEEDIIINVAKGIEEGTLMRISEIVEEIIPGIKYVALSGPTHAEEVILDYPSTIVAASESNYAAELVQHLFMNKYFRVYTNEDVVGVELGGALKNIIALAAGILEGYGYGDNTKAALMTRGIYEMSRLGTKLGAKMDTFFGLTGMGDLIVTCTSNHSRNKQCGVLIGKGVPIEQAIEQIGMVVEGIRTTRSASELAKKLDVEMPITEVLFSVLYEDKDLTKSIEELMLRERKAEHYS
ncbi:MAG: NAD(P)H-dependent glycerol-3-phosphate dehydrogenase [Tissierellia bacterium]|nr:NAD(P)H-dependent glycerol-3-phosphate dehydrogenase [Tissierellia bacterium]